MKQLILISFLLMCKLAFSQNIEVFDKILAIPIENVNIKSKQKGVITNSKGVCAINKFKENDTLIISHIAYHQIQIIKSSISSKIFLEPRIKILPTVNFELDKKALLDQNDPICETEAGNTKIASKTTAEKLEGNSGVTIQESQSGGGSPNFRGMEANRLLLVVDGIPLNNAIYRSGHLQSSASINPYFLGSIYLVSGPASVAYGNGAMGGALLFNTYTNTSLNENKFYFNQQFESATNGVLLNFLSQYHHKKLAFTSGFSVKSLENLKMGENRNHGYLQWGKEGIATNGNEQLFTTYQQADFMHKTFYNINKNSSILLNTQFATSSNINRFDKLNDIKDGIAKYSDWYYGPQSRFLQSLKHSNFKETILFQKMNTTLSFQDVSESRHKSKKSENQLSNRYENVKIYDISFDFSKSIKSLNISYGLGNRYQKVNSKADKTSNNIISHNSTRYPDGGSSVNDFFSYTQAKIPLHKKLKLVIGARYNQNNLTAIFNDSTTFNFPYKQLQNNNSSLVKSASLEYSLNTNTLFKTSYYGGFRNPNIDDIGKVFSKNGNYVVIPNEKLEAEYSDNYEMTIKYFKGKIKTNLSLFYTNINNAIRREFSTLNSKDSMLYDGEMMKIQMNKNIESANIYGININAIYEYNKSLNLNANFNYLKGNTMENQPLSHIPPTNGKLSINYTIKKQEFEFYAKYNAAKKSNEYDDGGVDNLEEATINGTPMWYTLNLQYSNKLDNDIIISCGVQNIADIHYKTFSSGISASGRNFILGLQTNF